MRSRSHCIPSFYLTLNSAFMKRPSLKTITLCISLAFSSGKKNSQDLPQSAKLTPVGYLVGKTGGESELLPRNIIQMKPEEFMRA